MKSTLCSYIVAAAILLLASATAFAQIAIPTEQIRLKGNHPALAEHMTSVGEADPQMLLTMRATLSLQNRAALDQLVIDQQDPTSPRYHQWLTQAEFDAQFGPSQAQAEEVARWLAGKGFQITGINLPLRSITFTGTSSQAEQTFQTSLKTFAGGSSYANATDPVIPAQFAGVVTRIDGLDNMHSFIPVFQRPQMGSGASIAQDSAADTSFAATSGNSISPDAKLAFGDYFGPNDFYSFYDETPLKAVHIDGASSNGDCIGIVGVSDFLNRAINSFNTRFGLPASKITRVPINAANPGFNSAEPEALIDLEWSHTAAPGAPIRYYMGAGPDDLLNAIDGAVTDNKCAVISISYGFCVSDNTYFTETLDPIFEQASSQGQSVFVASGDQGAAGIVAAADSQCVIGSSQNVSEMSADPNVTAVGGVSFNPIFNGQARIETGLEERAWNDSDDPNGRYPFPLGGASGGGASVIFAKPAYQVGEGVPDDGARDVPDISLMASPYYPGMVVADDKSCVTTGCSGKGPVIFDAYGGTSVSSPAFAGVVKLIEQIQGERLGNINPRLYTLANSGLAANGFRDIISGDNSFNNSLVHRVTGFEAGPGYDQTTGWGSVDIATFAQAFAGSLPPVAALKVRPARLTFGKVRVKRTKTLTITISNPKDLRANANISAITPGTGYTVSPNCLGILVSGASCNVSVTFAPDLSGTAYHSSLMIIDDANNSPQQVTLVGAAR
ncbi:MAG TPA: protease pro-enzyme activation domain-containing protein [Candidatus Binataceae bacterium]|nr:protease pro-enzyme activation domain-containing protein [Candidatus Binataceae bacterium]